MVSAGGENEIFRVIPFPSILVTGLIVAGAALQRRENRGGHYREDYPERDDVNRGKGIRINKNNFDLDG